MVRGQVQPAPRFKFGLDHQHRRRPRAQQQAWPPPTTQAGHAPCGRRPTPAALSGQAKATLRGLRVALPGCALRSSRTTASTTASTSAVAGHRAAWVHCALFTFTKKRVPPMVRSCSIRMGRNCGGRSRKKRMEPAALSAIVFACAECFGAGAFAQLACPQQGTHQLRTDHSQRHDHHDAAQQAVGQVAARPASAVRVSPCCAHIGREHIAAAAHGFDEHGLFAVVVQALA